MSTISRPQAQRATLIVFMVRENSLFEFRGIVLGGACGCMPMRAWLRPSRLEALFSPLERTCRRAVKRHYASVASSGCSLAVG